LNELKTKKLFISKLMIAAGLPPRCVDYFGSNLSINSGHPGKLIQNSVKYFMLDISILV